MSKRINIFLDDQEVRLIEALQKKYGGKFQQIIRDALKMRFDKAFPPHTIESKIMRPLTQDEENFTPEQKCERAGGRVETLEGLPKCVFHISSGFKRIFPLDSSEFFPKSK